MGGEISLPCCRGTALIFDLHACRAGSGCFWRHPDPRDGACSSCFFIFLPLDRDFTFTFLLSGSLRTLRFLFY